MNGFFELKTPQDLFAKLKFELGQLERFPTDVYVAFNFFVTAEHLLDWLYPGDQKENERASVRRGDPLLETVSHLASGAKHFTKLRQHHKSVSSTSTVSAPAPEVRVVSGNRTHLARPRIQVLSVELDGDAARTYGGRIDAVALARKVYEYRSQRAPFH